MNTISLTVPMDYIALTLAAEMLQGLAAAQSGPPVENELEASGAVNNDRGGSTDGLNNEGDLVDNSGDTSAANVFTQGQAPGPNADIVTGPDTSSQTQTVAPATVELDNDGLPWDSRIHSSSKGKLAKTQQWKKKRGVDPAIITQVEAELKAAMAVPGPNDAPATSVDSVTNTPSTAAPPPPPESAPSQEPVMYMVEGMCYTVDELKASNWTEEQIATMTPIENPDPGIAETEAPPPAATGGIITLPELMGKITSTGTPQETVVAACAKHGIAGVALLGARPDLIPTIAAELFPGG